MRPSSLLIGPLWLLLSDVAMAGYNSKSAEVEFFYRAYRMDVDVSSAELLAEAEKEGRVADPDVEKPWKIGRDIKGENMEDDWPDKDVKAQEDKKKRYGLNFHAFVTGAQGTTSSYGRAAARKKIKNPWEPPLSVWADTRKGESYSGERNNIARLPRDDGKPLQDLDDTTNDPIQSKQNLAKKKWSYEKLDPALLFGGLNKATGYDADYFDFDNMLAIIAKRASELYQKNPTVAGPHYEAMIKAADEAKLGRDLDGEKFKIGDIEKLMRRYMVDQQKLGAASVSKDQIKTTVETAPKTSVLFKKWKYSKFSPEETLKHLASGKANFPRGDQIKGKVNGVVGGPYGYRHVNELFARFEHYTNDNMSGLFMLRDRNGKIMQDKDGDRADDLFSQTSNHRTIVKRQSVLADSMRAQVRGGGNPNAPGCNWPDIYEPPEAS